jgi:hypothetical protein
MHGMFTLKLAFLWGGVEFLANIIVLKSNEIDVIIAMDWLRKHNRLINCAKKAIRLTPSNDKELEYVAENLVIDKPTSNRIVMNQLPL